jgi:hypothetical protein
MIDLTIKVGSKVRLKSYVDWRCPAGRENHRTATVGSLYQESNRANLNRELEGCYTWKVEDLELVLDPADVFQKGYDEGFSDGKASASYGEETILSLDKE